MGEWMPIESAPKDRVLLSIWDGWPVFIAYLRDVPVKDYVSRGWWPFKRLVWETVTHEEGWFVMCWSPRIGWGINGSCARFNPTHWMPLPLPPAGSADPSA